MLAYRVEKEKYVPSVLNGMPGEVASFRWNTKGHPIIYASESRSLALHEKGGNMSKPFYGLPAFYVLVAIELPDAPYRKIFPKDLPEGWNRVEAYHQATQEIGDQFTSSDELAIFVPSTIVRGEFNVLVNPRIALEQDLPVSVEQIDARLQHG